MKIKMEQDPNYKFWEPIHLDDDSNTTLILAGDLWNGLKSIDQIQEFHHRFARVIVVLGNHDYWSYKFFQTLADDYKDELEFRNMSNVFLLDRDCLEIGSDIFVGCSLYTNMDSGNPLVMMNAQQIMYPDFQYTITGETFDEHYVYRKIKLTPQEWYTKNKLDFEYIQYIVANNKDKNIHVITHHGCSFQSVHEKYKGYGMSNYFFVSDYDNFILDNPNIKTWIHGHVHNIFNYYIGDCQVIVNPRGYATKDGIENKEFDEVSLFDI